MTLLPSWIDADPTRPRAAEPPVALYVHLPFCVSHCPYCDFAVYAGAVARGPRAQTDRLYRAIDRELGLRARQLDRRFPDRPPLASVYFGGGTPSLVPAETFRQLMATIRAGFGLAEDAEITLEANPGPDERGDPASFAAEGVNRVSFGAQSMDPGELRRLGRRHEPRDVAEAVEAARKAGVRSVNLDLLYDVPGQSLESWRASLKSALDLGPDHLSLYALTLDDPDSEGLTGPNGDHLPTSPGARRWRRAAAAEQDDDRAATQYELAAKLLAIRGWRGYEISNWATRGQESRHNLAYWERRPYEAVGPGAHAFDGVTRRWNAADMQSYLGALEADPASLPPGGQEEVRGREALAEAVILGLRLDRGIPRSWAELPVLAPGLDWAAAAGLLETAEVAGETRLRLTTRGRLLSNEVFARVI